MAKTTINGTILHPDDTPETGYIYFALAETAGRTDVDAEFSRTPIRVNLDVSGNFTIQLQPTDDVDWGVSGLSYLVEERFSGKAPRRFYMTVPTSGVALRYEDLATYGNAPAITANIDLAAQFTAFQATVAATYEVRKANTVVLFGDSITAQCDNSGTTVDWFRWAQRIAGFPAKVLHNAGVGSNTTTQMLARIQADVVAYSPAWCIVLGGANDISANNASAAAVIANLQAIYTALNDAGISVIAGTITPSDYISASATKLGNMEKVNQWIKSYPLTGPNVRVVDWHAPLVDTTDGGMGTSFSDDTVHPNHRGACRMGRMLAPVLQDAMPELDRLNSSPVSNAAGNLMPNGLLTGNSGGVATSWGTGSFGAAITATPSKVARADLIPGEWQQVAYTSGDFALYAENTAVGVDWNVGDYVQGRCEIELDLPWTTLTFLYATVNAYPANVGIGGGDPIIGSVSPLLPAGDLPNRMVFETTPGAIPVGTTRVQFALRCVASGAGTFRLGRPDVRIVTP